MGMDYELLAALKGLAICSARPDEHHVQLAKKGYCVIETGRFGKHVSITSSGKKLLASLSEEQNIALTGAAIARTIRRPYSKAVDQPVGDAGPAKSRHSSRGSVPRTVTATETQATAAKPAAKPSEIAAGSLKGIKTGSTVIESPAKATSPPVGPSKVGAPSKHAGLSRGEAATTAGRREQPKANASSPAPNAVRVATGPLVTYYPVSYASKVSNGTCVVTQNKLFRAFPLAASSSDVVVS
jgi:hypothetical protein